MKKRTSKFWYDNERVKMEKLGLQSQPRSGAGPVHKEDGVNDYVLCQLKSTEGMSITVKRDDVEKLIYHADLINKVPIFVLDFLPDTLLVAAPVNELGNLADYLNKDLYTKQHHAEEYKNISDEPEVKKKTKKKIKSAGRTKEEMIKLVSEDIEEAKKEEPSFLEKAFAKRSK